MSAPVPAVPYQSRKGFEAKESNSGGKLPQRLELLAKPRSYATRLEASIASPSFDWFFSHLAVSVGLLIGFIVHRAGNERLAQLVVFCESRCLHTKASGMGFFKLVSVCNTANKIEGVNRFWLERAVSGRHRLGEWLTWKECKSALDLWPLQLIFWDSSIYETENQIAHVRRSLVKFLGAGGFHISHYLQCRRPPKVFERDDNLNRYLRSQLELLRNNRAPKSYPWTLTNLKLFFGGSGRVFGGFGSLLSGFHLGDVDPQ